MTQLEVVPLTPEREATYQHFLESQEASLLYYGVPYRDFLVELLGCRARYLLAVEGETIRGVLPTMERDGPFGRVVNSLAYFGSHGGVLAADPAARQTLQGAWKELLGSEGLAAATWIENPFQRAAEGIPPTHDLQDHRIGQFTDLGPWKGKSLEESLACIESSARRNVRKAIRSGVEVAVENDAWDALLSCHQEAMGAIGGKLKTPEFFRGISRHFRADEDYRIWVARQDGAVIATLLVFYAFGTVEYFVPATRLAHRSTQPLPLILARAMLAASEDGYSSWNWGGTWPTQEGVYRFKKKWGSADHPYDYFVRVVNRELLTSTPEDLSDAYPGFYVVPFSALEGTAS